MRLTIGVVATGLLLATVSAQRGPEAGEWRHYGGTAGSTKYSSLEQIGPNNVMIPTWP